MNRSKGNMNLAGLKQMGEHADVWVRTYCRVVEALMRHGVPAQEARDEARLAVNDVAFGVADDPSCPLCDFVLTEVTSNGDGMRRYICATGCGQEWEFPFE